MAGNLPDSLFREAWEVSSDGLVLFDTNGHVRAFDRKITELSATPVADAAIETMFPSGCRPLELLDAANPTVTRFCELTVGGGRRLPVRIECVRVQDGLLAAVHVERDRAATEDGPKWFDAFLNVTDAVIAILNRDGRFVRFNRAGSARLLSWCTTVTRDRAGKLEYVVGTAMDVTAIRKTECALASLSAEFLEAQAAARHDICGYLHDTISQNLLVLALLLGDLSLQPDPDTAANIEQAFCMLNRCCQDLRVVTYALAPPAFDDSDPTAAFDWYSRHMRDDARVDVEFKGGAVPPETSPEVRALLLAAIQEWSQKAIRHPDAGKTVITLKSVALANAMSELQLEVLCSQPENEAVRALLASPVIRECVQTMGGRCEAIRENDGIRALISVNAAGIRT
jgi:PAS domain-containing protein